MLKVKVMMRIIQILRAFYNFCLSSDGSSYDRDSQELRQGLQMYAMRVYVQEMPD